MYPVETPGINQFGSSVGTSQLRDLYVFPSWIQSLPSGEESRVWQQSVKPGMFDSVGSTELQNAGKAGHNSRQDLCSSWNCTDVRLRVGSARWCLEVQVTAEKSENLNKSHDEIDIELLGHDKRNDWVFVDNIPVREFPSSGAFSSTYPSKPMSVSETTATELVFQQEPIIKLRPSGGSGFCRPVLAADHGHALGQEQAHVLFLL
ncbi:hypothetical protein NL676_039824 [Syzygium grande]|nr:hypothetical protein NL676_039824 [Syzygium grande]